MDLEEGKLEVIEYLKQAGQLLVLLWAGEPSYEQDYVERIIAFPWKRIDEAIDRVWRE